MKYISSAGPSITQSEIDLVTEAIKHGWQDKMNFYIDEFVKEFKEYIDIKYCLPTAHCTDAIHLAMLTLNIGPGDEVIVPDLTWVASVSPVLYVGAKPVFADVDPVSWCLTAETIERCITDKTKAVVVVDLLGNMPQWIEIEEVCKKHRIHIIEDAAEGLGASYMSRKAGTFGDISLFSFNATKLIMSGQGGALCTNSLSLYEKAKLFSHHGIDKSISGKYFWSTVLGYNYNWTNIQAALALAQLRRIDELKEYKKWLFEAYAKRLKNIPGLFLSSTRENVDPSHWITAVIVDPGYGMKKEYLIQKFAEKNIDLRPMFYPVSSMPPFRSQLNTLDMSNVNKNCYEISEYGICLPNGNNLSDCDVDRVSDVFIELLGA